MPLPAARADRCGGTISAVPDPRDPDPRDPAGPPLRLGLVGSGYRTGAFLRVAAALPALAVPVGVVTRTAERGAQVTAQWGVPTHRTVADLLRAGRPDVVIALAIGESAATRADVRVGREVWA